MSKFRLVHFPQIPGPSFNVLVKTPEDGARMAVALADYDLFQYENNIKPDYSNTTLLEMWEDGEWTCWSRAEDDAELDDLIEEMQREGAFS